MFEITTSELTDLKFQIGTLKYAGRRALPKVFTEQGIAMLSSVLNSERAIQINIQIMRTFIRIREISIQHLNFRNKIDELEKNF